MSYQQVGNKTLRQLNYDNAAQHGTHSGATVDGLEEALRRWKELDEERAKLDDIEDKTPAQEQQLTSIERRMDAIERANPTKSFDKGAK